jgi:hypothetical protein
MYTYTCECGRATMGNGKCRECLANAMMRKQDERSKERKKESLVVKQAHELYMYMR